MTVTTQAIWTTPVAQSTMDACSAQVAIMVTAGQTDGIPVIIDDSPVAGQETVDRTWIDTASAQEWIDFLQSYGPVSAEIIV